jgi:hypothetical protein
VPPQGQSQGQRQGQPLPASQISPGSFLAAPMPSLGDYEKKRSFSTSAVDMGSDHGGGGGAAPCMTHVSNCIVYAR